MRSLLLFILSLAFTASVHAQAPVRSDRHVGAEARHRSEFMKLVEENQQVAQPAAESMKLSYFDRSLPTFQWVAPAIYGDYVLIDLGQRFTLPVANGFVDSVRIYFDTAWGARLAVSLFADTLYETGAGEFHLMNDFGTTEPYGGATIEAESIAPKSWVTINMAHAAVPKEFFVRITPENDGTEYISWYAIQTEQEPTRARTAENSRSAFYGVAGQQYTTAILDSTFTSLENDQILIGDFWIEAFVSYEASSVSTIHPHSIKLYPNPVVASQPVRIDGASAMSSIVITNMLGVEVARWNGVDPQDAISTAGLASGVYHVVVRAGGVVSSERLIIH